MQSSLYCSDSWFRAGPGLRLSFNCTAQQLDALLREHLLPEFSPYSIVTFSVENHGGTEHWSLHELTIAEFVALTDYRETTAFIRSHALHPFVDWQKFDYAQACCSLSGMICLQFEQFPRLALRSDIAIVWKIENLLTHEQITHVEYRRIFERLKRGIKKMYRKPS